MYDVPEEGRLRLSVCARTDGSLRLLGAVDTHVAGAIPCSVVTFGTDRHGLAVGRQADGEPEF